MDNRITDVAIIGAGPYGLSLAANLRRMDVDHRIFGKPMDVWRNMSKGMHLKSYGYATSIKTPESGFDLPTYCRQRSLEDYEPILIETFANYGVWVQTQLVPHLEQVDVASVRSADGEFDLALESGETLHARRVVVATGLSAFHVWPEFVSGLPRESYSHTAHISDFSGMRGQDVAVIGGGQSALQAAALLQEHGAHPLIVSRDPVRWNWRGDPDARRSLLDRLRLPNSVLGPGRDNWTLQHFPMAQHYRRAEKRLEYTRHHFAASGAWWLKDRVDGVVETQEGARVVAAESHGSRVTLTIDRGEQGRVDRAFDHVVAGTGYLVDVDRLPFLDAAIRGRISRYEGTSPRLSRHFESSVPGLYFMGPASAASFGPLFRFVSGSYYTVPTVARRLARTRQKAAVMGRLPAATGG